MEPMDHRVPMPPTSLKAMYFDPSARCPCGGGHKWRETDEDWRDGRPVQVLKCERCGAESVGYLEDLLGWDIHKNKEKPT